MNEVNNYKVLEPKAKGSYNFKKGRHLLKTTQIMDKMIAPCGIDCSKCPAYLATQNDDKEALAETAAEWSKQFGEEIKPEDIICDGCIGEGRKASYCAICEVRTCCTGRGKESCADCEEYICPELEKIFEQASEAKENLEQMRKKK